MPMLLRHGTPDQGLLQVLPRLGMRDEGGTHRRHPHLVPVYSRHADHIVG